VIKRIASLVGLVLVTGANSFVLFFASMLAAGGDGSSQGIYEIQFFGGLFIFVFFFVGLYRWHKGHDGIVVAAMALPIAFALSTGFLLVARTLGFHVG